DEAEGQGSGAPMSAPPGQEPAPRRSRGSRGALAQQGPAQPPDFEPRSPAVDLPPIEGPPGIEVPALPQEPEVRPPSVEALLAARPEAPESGDETEPAPRPSAPCSAPLRLPTMPGTQRFTYIWTRSGREVDYSLVETTPEGVEIYVIRGGVNIV